MYCISCLGVKTAFCWNAAIISYCVTAVTNFMAIPAKNFVSWQNILKYFKPKREIKPHCLN